MVLKAQHITVSLTSSVIVYYPSHKQLLDSSQETVAFFSYSGPNLSLIMQIADIIELTTVGIITVRF